MSGCPAAGGFNVKLNIVPSADYWNVWTEVPLGITIWVLHALVSTLDETLLLLPERWRPHALVGYDVPGVVCLDQCVAVGDPACVVDIAIDRDPVRAAQRLASLP